MYSGAEYLFIIMNIDRVDKKGTNWWSFSDLHQKKEVVLLDSFRFGSFKEFITKDSEKILDKILNGIEQFF